MKSPGSARGRQRNEGISGGGFSGGVSRDPRGFTEVVTGDIAIGIADYAVGEWDAEFQDSGRVFDVAQFVPRPCTEEALLLITRGPPVNAKSGRWLGRCLTAVFAVFMLVDIAAKLLNLPVVDQTMGQLGWRAGYGILIGSIELIALALYIFPRTAVLGSVLMTGVLGGAIATHLRVQSPLFTHTLFGVYLGLAMWGGLWLRTPSLRAMVPVAKSSVRV